MLHAVAQGLLELQLSNHRAQFTTETLRVDAKGDLKFLGFVERGSFDALGELRRVAAFLLKQTFAEAATMRLDDQYGALAFSEELKSIARRLDATHPQAFQNLQEAASAIAFYTPTTRLRADFALQTDVGREREINEDSGLILTTNRQATLKTHAWELYVVADGMGGHEGGEVASDLTLTSLVRNLEAQAIDFDDNVAVRKALIQVIDAVNAEVVALTETPKYKGTRAKPGSTLTFGLRVGARVFIGNVGDSRTYKYANRVLERVSKDHSYVQTLIDAGDITEEEAFTHPDGSVITAHIGYPKLKQRDVFLRLFRPGETLLLVSDGVTDMLRDAEYEAHLTHDDPADVCRAFVDAANEAGGADNITVVCVKFR
jgi:protein phosphatase